MGTQQGVSRWGGFVGGVCEQILQDPMEVLIGALSGMTRGDEELRRLKAEGGNYVNNSREFQYGLRVD